MSFSRPSTPCSSISLSSVTNTTGARHDFVYHHHNNDSDCCRTPTAHMMPLMPHETPLAPRPRKRVYDCQNSLATFAEHDLFMPTADSLKDRVVAIVENDDDEDQVSLDYLPATPPPRLLAPPRIDRKAHFPRRRKVDSTSLCCLAPSLADLDTTTTVTPNNNVVRISYRPSLEESLGLSRKISEDTSSCDHADETTTAAKLPPTRQARMNMFKRRNSYGAVCA